MPFDALSPNQTLAARSGCALCPAGRACLANGLSREDAARWDGAQLQRLSLPVAGKSLFRAGDAADAIYVVRAGCIKSSVVDEDGNERVRGFFFPGDVIGFESLGADRHPSGAQAVVASQVCRIPRSQLQAIMAASPVLAQRIVERITADLRLSLAIAGDYSADQRLAAFLVQMHERLAHGGVLKLPMTRRDIGNYLRLATETVCRVLARFEAKGWVAACDKTLTVHKPSALSELASPFGVTMPQRLAA